MNNRTHCPQGHDYSEENTYRYKGSRYCRTCLSNRLAVRRRKKRQKEKFIDEFGEELGSKLYEKMKEKI